MKNDLKYILLTLVLLVGTLVAGTLGVAAMGVSGEESQWDGNHSSARDCSG